MVITIMTGSRCKDGVVLVSDRRLVRAGGLELQPPECKLRALKGVLIGAVGMTTFYNTVEKLLMTKFPDITVLATAWDIADLADDVIKQYEGFRDDRPFFPVVDRVNGKAMLWQVTAELPPGEMDYEAWGRSEAYKKAKRLFETLPQFIRDGICRRD